MIAWKAAEGSGGKSLHLHYPTHTDSSYNDLRQPQQKSLNELGRSSWSLTLIGRSIGNWWLEAVSFLQRFRALRCFSWVDDHTLMHIQTKLKAFSWHGGGAEHMKWGHVSIKAHKLGEKSGSREKMKGIQGKRMDLIQINNTYAWMSVKYLRNYS